MDVYTVLSLRSIYSNTDILAWLMLLLHTHHKINGIVTADHSKTPLLPSGVGTRPAGDKAGTRPGGDTAGNETSRE